MQLLFFDARHCAWALNMFGVLGRMGFEEKMIMFCLSSDLGMMYLTLEEDLFASLQSTYFTRSADRVCVQRGMAILGI